MTTAAPIPRLLVLIVCFLGATALGAKARRPESAPEPAPLSQMPLVVDSWRGYDAAPFGAAVLAQLGVDDYINRVYVVGDQPVSLYVGYYRSQRAGDTIHSPQNCLPGAGWLPVTTTQVTVPVDGRPGPITVNRLLIQKGIDRQVVLYWYQSQGRIVASDYLSKAFLIYDAARRHRSDAAMVRVISPVLPSDSGDEVAEARALAFVKAAFPQIDRRLPI